MRAAPSVANADAFGTGRSMMAHSPDSPDATSPLFASFAVPAVGEAALAWRTILHRGVELRLPKGSLVPTDGERRFDLFYLERGQVDVIFDTSDGRGRSVESFLPGSMFHLAPAATRREASGQYLCVSDAVIHRLPGELLHDPPLSPGIRNSCWPS